MSERQQIQLESEDAAADAESLRERDALERRATGDEQMPHRVRESQARLEREEGHAEQICESRCAQRAQSAAVHLRAQVLRSLSESSYKSLEL